jgi:hypothetical protein
MPLSGARQTIDNARDLSARYPIEVIVSDNSDDDDKAEQLQALSTGRFRYLRAPASDALDNWNHALGHAEGEFACFLSDDDMLVALPGFDSAGLDAPKGAAGIRPTMALYTEQAGIYAQSSFDIPETRAVDRVRSYFQKNGGANTTLFSCFRRELIQDLIGGIHAHHPTKGGYSDWSWVLGLISSGPLVSNSHLLYVYNNRNWANPEDIVRNTRRTFRDAGLPEDASQILLPLTALDAFGTICRESSPVSLDEKREAGLFAVAVYFDAFVSRLRDEAFTRDFAPERLDLAREMAREAVEPRDKLAASLLLADEWIPGSREAYARYYGQTLTHGALRGI